MISSAIHLFGTVIGAIAWDPDRELGIFEYDPGFLDSGVEVAPLTLPLRAGRFSFPELAKPTFKGLPGLLADSLPDKFGNLLIDQWLASRGRSAASFNPVERLCYLGTRGMGALEFQPVLLPDRPPERLELESLLTLARDVLNARSRLQVKMKDPDRALAAILRVGTSAGGARAKAVISWHPDTGEIRSGQVDPPEGFEPWLLKFDGVEGNADKELADPVGFGRIEYAYHLMARAAGITMMDCRLLEENGRAHFMTRRFDRLPDGRKLHLQSLCGMAHFDFNQAGAFSYEQAFLTARQLNLPHPDQAELFRRAVFNIMGRNQDDHTKNLAFLMDRRGIWSLAPAYDLAYAHNPDGLWTYRHQMTLAGKRDAFTPADLLQAGASASLKPSQAKSIIRTVHAAVKRWPEFAAAAGVPPSVRDGIARELRVDLLPKT
ncbi:MAG: toxin HipA [Verrucomicrobiales bacterium]|nr:toxin HipA [Verrucomicrobiales bacterium]